MPPPAPVGLFQTPMSLGPTVARSPAAADTTETPFSSVRQYLQQSAAERRRATGVGAAPRAGMAAGVRPPGGIGGPYGERRGWYGTAGTPQASLLGQRSAMGGFGPAGGHDQ